MKGYETDTLLVCVDTRGAQKICFINKAAQADITSSRILRSAINLAHASVLSPFYPV